MKAQNNKIVRKAYFQFTGYLLIVITLAVGILFFFMKTSSVEVRSILEKTEEYDRIYTRQLALVESVDSIYQYISLLNTSPKINNILLQSVISTRKMSLLESLNSMNEKDCLFYKKAMNDVNIFLKVRDSIRIVTMQEELIRGDLLRCVDENKQVVRKLSAGGLIYEKK